MSTPPRTTRLSPNAYLEHLQRESRRFRTVLAETDPAAPVPTCSDWDAVDLLWHLGEVQRFWSMIISDRPASPDDHAAPERPASQPELLAFFDTWSNTLVDTLAAADPAEPAWSWSSDQTVAFSYRRQAHEALIHRVDAELTAGVEPSPLDQLLATDGVDEALAVMFGGQPTWGTFMPAGWTVRVDLIDTGVRTWTELGRFRGTDPDDGARYDEPGLRVIADPGDADPDAVVEGRAGVMDAWLWGRRDPEGIDLSGSPAALEEFRAVVGQAID